VLTPKAKRAMKSKRTPTTKRARGGQLPSPRSPQSRSPRSYSPRSIKAANTIRNAQRNGPFARIKRTVDFAINEPSVGLPDHVSDYLHWAGRHPWGYQSGQNPMRDIIDKEVRPEMMYSLARDARRGSYPAANKSIQKYNLSPTQRRRMLNAHLPLVSASERPASYFQHVPHAERQRLAAMRQSAILERLAPVLREANLRAAERTYIPGNHGYQAARRSHAINEGKLRALTSPRRPSPRGRSPTLRSTSPKPKRQRR
jgi:hypothetical protein